MSRKTKNDSRGAANRHTGDFRMFSSVSGPLGKGVEKAGQSPTGNGRCIEKKARKPDPTKWVKKVSGPAFYKYRVSFVDA